METLKTDLLSTFDKVTQSLKIDIDPSQREKLIDFVLMINKWNKAFNLTSVRDPQQMVIKHIVDSIVIAPYLNRQAYIDVGTGPGLPGIPLSIMHPDKHFVLLDSLGKRVRFMKQAKFELDLKNIEPVQSRVEQYQPDLPLDAVLSRAFASIKDMLHWCQHLVDSQGEFLALKGQFPEQEIALLPSGFEVIESIELAIPVLEGERHLIKIRKVS